MPSPPPPDDNDTSSLYHPVTSPSMRPIPTSTLKTHLTMTSPLSSQPRILKHMGKPFTPAVPNLTSKIIYIDHLLHTLTKTTTPSYHQDTPSTVNHTTTSYIHIPPDKLIPIILTNLPTYLTPTTTSLRVDPATTYSQYISPNESLLFFILPVRTAKRKTGVRRTISYEFFLNLEHTPATNSISITSLHSIPSSTLSTFSKQRRSSLGTFQMAVDMKRKSLRSSSRVRVPLIGTITLTPHPPSCTALTLSLSLPTPPARKKLKISPNKHMRRVSLAVVATLPSLSSNNTSPNPVRKTLGFQRPTLTAAAAAALSSLSFTSLSESSPPPSNNAALQTVAPALAASLLSALSSVTPQLHTSFATPSIVDEYERSCTLSLLSSSPPLPLHESDLITSTLAFADSPTGWSRIPNTATSAITYHAATDTINKEAKIARATTTIDTSHTNLFAYLWNFSSYDRTLYYLKHYGPKFRRRYVLSPTSVVGTFMINVGGGFDARIFVVWFTWLPKTDGGHYIAFTDASKHPDPSVFQKVLREIEVDKYASVATIASTTGLYEITPVAPNVSILTLTQSGVFNGSIPGWMMDYYVKDTLDICQVVRDKFERRGDRVDEEARAAYPVPPLIPAPGADPILVEGYDSCISIEQAFKTDPAPIVSLPASSPFLTMSMKELSTPLLGVVGTIVGTVSATIDIDALQTIAWAMSFTSRAHMAGHKRGKHLVRLVAEQIDTHHSIIAVIKRTPRPFIPREFVERQMAFRTSASPPEYVYCGVALPDSYVVDYGQKFKSVRANATTILRVTPLTPSQCTVTMYLTAGLGGWVPTALIAKWMLPPSLKVIATLREMGNRDGEIDAINRGALEEEMRAGRLKEGGYEEGEEEVVDRCCEALHPEKYPTTAFTSLPCDSPFVKMYYNLPLNSTSGTLRATSLIDASASDCAAWEMKKMSRLQQKMIYGNVEERWCERNSERGILLYTRVGSLAPGFSEREFLLQGVWRWEKGASSRHTLHIGYESVESEKAPIRSGRVRGDCAVFWVFEEKEGIVDAFGSVVPQTEVSYTVRLDLKGFIPREIVAPRGGAQLSFLVAMREEFENSGRVDGGRRKRIASRFEADQVYTVAEDAMIDTAMKFEEVFDQPGSKRRVVKAREGVVNDIAQNENSTIAWGRSECIVRAPMSDVAAYFWDFTARCRWSSNDLSRESLRSINGHHQIAYVCKSVSNRKLASSAGETHTKRRRGRFKSHLAIKPRDFLANMLWKKKTEGSIVICAVEASEDENAKVDESTRRRLNAVGGKGPLMVRISELVGRTSSRARSASMCMCKIVYVGRLDFGWSVPKFAMNLVIRQSLTTTMRCLHYFQEHRDLKVYDVDDGKALGLRLMGSGENKRQKRWEGVEEIVKGNEGLRELAEEFPWLVSFLREAVRGQLHLNKPCSTKLEVVVEEEGMQIGRNLGQALRQRKTASAGMYQWKMQNRAMVELFEKHKWMEALVLTISQAVLKTAPWGLVWRVFMGAALSLLDIASDINVIFLYMRTSSQSIYGWQLLAMVILNLLMQIVVVVVQHKRNLKEVFKEVLFVVTFIKPGVDALRVASGKELEEHHLLSAQLELAAMKGVELFSESIPGCVLQMYALFDLMLSGGNQAIITEARVSIAISALVTGYTSATLSYDFDTDPSKRRRSPAFYGYIPDEPQKRLFLFTLMTLNGALLLIIKSIAYSLVALINKSWCVMFFVGDVGLFFTLKFAQRDFTYWLPIYGCVGLVLNIAMRWIVKIIVDFTAIVHYRHAGEAGGLYYTLNLIAGFGFSLLAVYVYESNTIPAERVFAIEQIWTNMVFLVSSNVCLFVVFFFSINKKFRSTFFSTLTGVELSQQIFSKSKEDAEKSQIFRRHRGHWVDIEDDVKRWLHERWYLWMDEKPEWFTPALRAGIPEEIVPDGKLRRHTDEKIKAGRKSKKKSGGGIKLSMLKGPSRRQVKIVEEVESEHSEFECELDSSVPGSSEREI